MRLLFALFACLIALATAGAALAAPYGGVVRNPADKLASKPIDDYRYDHAKRCVKHPRRARWRWWTGWSTTAAECSGLILMLLATDKAGNPHALARRMGVQEIIWDCRSWWSGADRMGPYSVCYDSKDRKKKHVDETLGHLNHVHLGLSLRGARMQTSFWRSLSAR
jgi:hypothetical protein